MSSKSISNELQSTILNSLIHHITKAEQAFGCQFAIPDIRYNVRGKVAGKAYLTQWQIRLNPTLLLENQSAFIEQVIPHELAHLITYHQFGRVKPHGQEWQYVMSQIFNLIPETRHNFDTTSVQGKTFLYQCLCRDHSLSIRRHNKIKRQQAHYHCLLCGELLTLKIENMISNK